MSDDGLIGAKRRVGRMVLGQHGVHGVGATTSAGEVVVHLDPKAGGLPDGLLEQAQDLARPFDLRVVEEDAPSFG